MIDELEQRLRDELASHVDGLPAPGDVTDLVIGRAVRVRRRRRVMGVVSAVVLLVVIGSVVLPLSGDSGDDRAATPGIDMHGLSAVVDEQDITTPDGDRIETGMATIEDAWEVDGGWLLHGLADREPNAGLDVVRFVDRDARTSDLVAGTISRVFPNERGDAAVVEWFDMDRGDMYLDMYGLAAADGPILLDQESEPSGLQLGGMAGDLVWFTVRNTELRVGTWTAGGTIEMVDSGTAVEPLAAIKGGLLLADVSPIGDMFCPAVVDPNDQFRTTIAGQCYEQTLVYPSDVVISGDGELALVYAVSADFDDEAGSPDASTASGEWARLDLRMQRPLVPTGEDDKSPPVFGVDDTPVFDVDLPDGTRLIPVRAAG